MKQLTTFLAMLLLLLGFNALFFICSGSDNSLSIWISYGYVNYAILLPFVIAGLKWKRTEFKYVAMSATLIYTAIAFVLGIVLMLIDPANCKWPLVINTIPFIISAFTLTLIRITNHKS
jgi:hypothetical protein